MTSESFNRPVPLEGGHDLSAFDCGDQRLNDYLRKYALANHQNRSARTYVAMRGERVVGFYTLAAGSVGREETPRRVAEGLGRYPVPVILLARLAVDAGEQGRGLGGGLLKDAILRSCARRRHYWRSGTSHARQRRFRACLLHALWFRAVAHRPLAPVSFDEGHLEDAQAMTTGWSGDRWPQSNEGRYRFRNCTRAPRLRHTRKQNCLCKPFWPYFRARTSSIVRARTLSSPETFASPTTMSGGSPTSE